MLHRLASLHGAHNSSIDRVLTAAGGVRGSDAWNARLRVAGAAQTPLLWSNKIDSRAVHGTRKLTVLHPQPW